MVAAVDCPVETVSAARLAGLSSNAPAVLAETGSTFITLYMNAACKIGRSLQRHFSFHMFIENNLSAIAGFQWAL